MVGRVGVPFLLPVRVQMVVLWSGFLQSLTSHCVTTVTLLSKTRSMVWPEDADVFVLIFETMSRWLTGISGCCRQQRAAPGAGDAISGRVGGA
jgi:hypothetical protein